MNALRTEEHDGILCRDGCMADELQLDVAGIKAQLVHIASSIEELKESLIPLKELGHAFARMDERMGAMQRMQDALAVHRESTNDFISRAKGGLAVGLVLFTLINGILSFAVSRWSEVVSRHDVEIRELKEKKHESNPTDRQPR